MSTPDNSLIAFAAEVLRYQMSYNLPISEASLNAIMNGLAGVGPEPRSVADQEQYWAIVIRFRCSLVEAEFWLLFDILWAEWAFAYLELHLQQ